MTTQTLHAAFASHVAAALDALEAAGTLPAGLNRAAVTVEPPRDVTHGDLATNAAMVLAKPAGTNPRALATALVAELEKLDLVKSAEIAGPGFINLRLLIRHGSMSCAPSPRWATITGAAPWARAPRSMWNMSRPTRPAPCIWAIAAARWWAMRWPACWNMPGTR
jgi:hypothetical protein